jgi:hypothetical protein
MQLRRFALVLAPCLGCLFGWLVQAQEEAGPSNVGQVVEAALRAQVEALNAEDPDRVLELFHPQAQGVDQARRNLVQMFRAQDLRYSLERYRFVATDEPYAYARATQATRGGPRPTRTEQLFVFRRDGSAWRFWTSVVLDTEPGPSGKR